MSDTTLEPETAGPDSPGEDALTGASPEAGFGAETGAESGTDPDDLPDDDRDYVYIPRESGVIRKTLSVLVLMLIVVAVVLGGAGLYVVNQFTGGEKSGDPFTVTIPDGATMAQAADILEEQGVIKNGTVFRYYAKWKNVDSMKAGDYDQLYKGMSIDDTIARMKAGPLPQRFSNVTFPEGLWQKDIHAKILNAFPEMTETELAGAEGFFKLTDGKYHKAGQSLEGFLFPATYRVEKSDVAEEAKLIGQMMTQFEKVADETGLDQAPLRLQGVAGKASIGPYEALIVASMVEREAKVDADRAKIARVIYNRLQRGMKLQIDATTLYCLGEHKEKLTKSDLDIDCAWNTRVKDGLPPTPIGSPGKKSLEAALNPEAGPWLYYVLKDKEGNHFFTDDSKAFERQRQESEKAGLL